MPKPKRNRKLRILLVDDHPVVRDGIRSWLSQQPSLEVAGEAADGEEAIESAVRLQPDLVLMDISLPRMSGLDAAKILRQRVPKAQVLILSVHNKKEFVLEIVRSGARGYVLKEAGPTELLKAIETVAAGEVYFSAPAAKLLLQEHVRRSNNSHDGVDRLSNREREVLVSIAGGSMNKEIAVRLGLSLRTIETHRESIMRKLDIHTVAGLTKFAITEGLVDLDSPVK